MLKLSRKSALAIEAVLDIAYNARPDPVQSRDITARQGVPQRYLEQVLQRLVREGVLRGVRGPRGGYTLARERRRVSIGDVVRVVYSLDSEEDEAVSSAELGEKVVAPLWESVQADMLRQLDMVTMEDLCRKARELQVECASEGLADYSI